MIILLSPAKTLDFETPVPRVKHSQPELLDHSPPLVAKLRKLSVKKLAALMGVSEKLAVENVERYRDWSVPFTPDNARPAIFAFHGDVYRGFDVAQLNARDLTFAQKHLRVLSGLYGVLRPLDLMQPYRLEMGTRLGVGRKKSLYEYWGATITEVINRALHETKSRCVVNLASNEYFGAVMPEQLDAPVIAPAFKENRNGSLKMISFSAKKARGMLARHIITNRIRKPEDLRGFVEERYKFDKKRSTDDAPLFVRKGP